ncbi:tRNA modification GTPase TrmE [Candidatus Protochlamydia naegleriophila]|uniref:tRNA modification GTPase MnmE n=1 Tax=Candidatus Protochlamydia naegleriophila TaxID=389348 RepID=A0A0U5JJE0_9BACT|nr:tRNA uridine-5-carboxymethylaminomethyl(34) synthesis GTPase MnmE [Candidatus Protochlamydia naegleriophila]CUI17926.1 tRNA modification GTPase TrmE [Candidatus Protochlamydia naegleriophila]
MEFIHQPYFPGETIAAIATPPGEGGVAIIRISGDDALAVAARIFSGPILTYRSHTAHFGHIYNAQGEHVDDVLVLVMLGKRSYTGENTVEIHCHGGGLITRRVLEVVLNAGARAALPGEFTFKAFMNGKMDLAQAEAVQELICAKNEKALDAAEGQLKGSLSTRVLAFQHTLTQIAAILEAWVDFPEEGLEFATMEELNEDLEQVATSMEKLVKTFHDGKILHDGLSLCLVGCPNVGKSSLMNALLDKDRAIVSPIPGTTRDVLEDHLRLNGLHIKLSDTAGIREAHESIEQEGIRRSKQAMQQADLILLVLDAHKGLEEEDLQLLAQVPQKKTIVVWNKMDLSHPALPKLDVPYLVHLSAKEREGLDQLHAAIDTIIWSNGPPSKEEILITNIRHKEALVESIEAIRRVQEGLRLDVSPEFLTLDMRQSLGELGKIIGTNISEDILSAIFSKFCIGK